MLRKAHWRLVLVFDCRAKVFPQCTSAIPQHALLAYIYIYRERETSAQLSSSTFTRKQSSFKTCAAYRLRPKFSFPPKIPHNAEHSFIFEKKAQTHCNIYIYIRHETLPSLATQSFERRCLLFFLRLPQWSHGGVSLNHYRCA